MVYNAKSFPVPPHKCAFGLRKVRRYGNSTNRFPAGNLRYQETELIYIFLKSFGGW